MCHISIIVSIPRNITDLLYAYFLVRLMDSVMQDIYFCLLGRQVPQSGAKTTAIDMSSLAAPSLCSSTTVTTVFQQPIMSPAMPPLCLDPLSLPLTKRTEEEEEVSFTNAQTK